MPELSTIQPLGKWLLEQTSDTAARTALITSFVLTCCQVACDRLTHRMPSLLLVSPDDTQSRNLDRMLQLMVTSRTESAASHRRRAMAFKTPRQAYKAMDSTLRLAAAMKANRQGVIQPNAFLVKNFQAASQNLFGSGISRPYAKAWRASLGLITDLDDRLILRLDTFRDILAFRKDLIDKNPNIIQPSGVGSHFSMHLKHVALSGALTPEQWQANVIQGALLLPFPVLFLPQPQAAAQIQANDKLVLEALLFLGGHLQSQAVLEPYNTAPIPGFAHYTEILRTRLCHLPADYEHAIHRLVRQIPGATIRLAHALAEHNEEDRRITGALAWDLSAYSVRGIVISVAGLAWHGLGFDSGCTPEEAGRILDYLRRHGPMTAGELLRRTHIRREMRDTLVSRFAEQDLVRVEGKMVRATNYPEFVEALYARAEFPEPKSQWAALRR